MFLRTTFLSLMTTATWGQLNVSVVAGRAVPSGVAAQNAVIGSISSITFDPEGRLVFCDSANGVIRESVRTAGSKQLRVLEELAVLPTVPSRPT
jgi:hypothetical protein